MPEAAEMELEPEAAAAAVALALDAAAPEDRPSQLGESIFRFLPFPVLGNVISFKLMWVSAELVALKDTSSI
jgi:hypothetical protein